MLRHLPLPGRVLPVLGKPSEREGGGGGGGGGGGVRHCVKSYLCMTRARSPEDSSWG